MASTSPLKLARLDSSATHIFKIPAKLINEGTDLSTFLVSQGYEDILTFLGQLNKSMFPEKSSASAEPLENKNTGDTTVEGIAKLLRDLDLLINEAPPDPGPRRFGNKSFRKWFEFTESKASKLLEEYLPGKVTTFKHSDDIDAIQELKTYLLGSFGSAQRLDYGTGHELSFLAFLAGIWKLGGFSEHKSYAVEREIVLGAVQPYLTLVRKLILTYNLEPAGTHGVWGLDDHSFVPYVFGSAQYGPAINNEDITPTEGSSPGAPDPGDVAKADRVKALRGSNMYFDAIGFIYDVKKGPFWEHSPTLYDISGVKAGWGKINKGMMKMYNAEVLSKFPVVQHFPFGSLFEWERSPNATVAKSDIHAQSQPQLQRSAVDAAVPGPINVTSTMQGTQAGLTRAPWAGGGASTATGRVPPSRASGGIMPSTQAPWARPSGSGLSAARLPPAQETAGVDPNSSITKAPWAK